MRLLEAIRVVVTHITLVLFGAMPRSTPGSQSPKGTEIATLNAAGKKNEKGAGKTAKEIITADYRNCPESNGKWVDKEAENGIGIRGESLWVPDLDYTPQEKSKPPQKPYSNPDNLTWGQLLEKYNITGVPFKNGEPDFSKVSKGKVEIKGFETGGTIAKKHNFTKADINLAKEKGVNPIKVREWRENNNYTWHECCDRKTMIKAPNEIHANITHRGGRAKD